MSVEALINQAPPSVSPYLRAVYLWGIRFFFLGLAARIKLYDRLGSFLSDGVSVYEAANRLSKRLADRGDAKAVVLKDLLSAQEAGRPLASALLKWVPSTESAMIDAGEASSALADGFFEAARIGRTTSERRSALVGGLSYPIVILMIVINLLAGFYLYMVPRFESISSPKYWSGVSAFVYELSRFVVKDGPYLAIAGAVLIGFMIWSMPRVTGPFRERFLDRLPPWSFYKVAQSSAFLIALSSMLKVGIPMQEALRKIRSQSSPWLSLYIDQMLRRLEFGSGYGEVLSCPMFDIDTSDDLAIYGSLSSFDEAIQKIGRNATENSLKKIQGSAVIIRYVMMLVAGLCIGGIFMAIMGISSSIQASMGGMH